MKTYLRGVLALGALGGLLLAQPGFAGKSLQDEAQKPEKAQDAVAAKVKFEEIKPSDPTVEKALGAKDVDAAKKLVGKEGVFKGTVTKVYTARNNSLILLDFDANFREALMAKLEPENYAKFPKMKDLVNKQILIKGKFILYKTQPQIELTDPAQIKIIGEK